MELEIAGLGKCASLGISPATERLKYTFSESPSSWSAPSLVQLVLSSATHVPLIPFRPAYIGHVYSDDNPGIPEDLIGDNGEISSVCLNRVSDLPLMVYLELDMELKIYVPRSLFVRLFHPPTLSGKQSKRGRTVAPRRFLH